MIPELGRSGEVLRGTPQRDFLGGESDPPPPQDAHVTSGHTLSTEEIRYRAMLAQINHEMKRGTGPVEPPPTQSAPPPEPEPQMLERGHSTAGIIDDAHTDAQLASMDGPKTAAELWLIATPRPSIWR